MDKRQFLKTSGVLITGGVLSRLVNGRATTRSPDELVGQLPIQYRPVASSQDGGGSSAGRKEVQQAEGAGRAPFVQRDRRQQGKSNLAEASRSDDAGSKVAHCHASAGVSPTASLLRTSMARVLPCTIWPRCHMFPSRAHAPLPLMVRAARMATCQRLSRRWKSSRLMARS